MADRLKDIWNGFAQRTGASLTSTGLSPLTRPSGTDRAERELDMTLSGTGPEQGGSEAVRAALDTLHHDIQSKAKRQRRPRRGEQASFAGGEHEPRRFEPPSSLEQQLLGDIQFTEARIRRSSSDYLGFARARQEAWKGKRKKFLGIF
jgi:hypothetical protein